MTISPKDVKMLWGRSAGLCSMPDCRRPLIIDETEADATAVVGEMCHIVAGSEDGPRGDAPLPKAQRDDYENLILLCRHHHAIIDNQPDTWTIDRLHKTKQDHEEWVRTKAPGYDQAEQADDEVYAGIVGEWERRCDLDHWTDWGSFVLGSGQPRLSVERDQALEDLRRWLLNRHWPNRSPRLESAFENFRRVLQDFHNTFHEHAEKPTVDNDWLLTKKFYQIDEWNEQKYNFLAKKYDFHVNLVEDLFLELTRAGNLVCERVRNTLLPMYRQEAGKLTAVWGPIEPDARFVEAVIEYVPEEKEHDIPYPGLEQFKHDRENRDRHFGNGSDPKQN